MVASTSKELLEQQLAEATRNRRRIRGVQESRGTGVRYLAQLRQIARMIRNDINEMLLPLLRDLAPEFQQDALAVNDHAIETFDQYLPQLLAVLRLIRQRWSSEEFQRTADRIAGDFVQTADRVNRERYQRSIASFGINIFRDQPEILEYVQASIFDNTRLITSIPEQYLTQVESIVLTNVRAGGRPGSIARLLRDQFQVTENRARLIARDQTAKVNGDLARMRQTSTGFQYFRWRTVGDERVRDRHDDIADKVTAYGRGIYRWDNPPLSDQGVPITPGQDFQCRCIAEPVPDSVVEENQRLGRVQPGVLR